MDLYKTWEGGPLFESRKLLKPIKTSQELKEKLEGYDETGTEQYFIAIRICNYFVHIGHLVINNYIKVKDIEDILGGSIIRYYELFDDYIKEERKKDPRVFENFQKLRERIKDG